MMTTMTRMTIHRRGHGRGTWATAEAKARFSEVIDHALADGPQTITRNGQKAVVVVSAEEWQRRPNAKATLRSSSQHRPCEARTSRLSGPRMGRARSSCEFSARHQRGVGMGQVATGPQRYLVAG